MLPAQWQLTKLSICVLIDWRITTTAANYERYSCAATKQTKERKSNRARVVKRAAMMSKWRSALKTGIYHFIAFGPPCVRCFNTPEMLMQHHPGARTYNLWTPRLSHDLTELPAEWETSWLHTTTRSIRKKNKDRRSPSFGRFIF